MTPLQTSRGQGHLSAKTAAIAPQQLLEGLHRHRATQAMPGLVQWRMRRALGGNHSEVRALEDFVTRRGTSSVLAPSNGCTWPGRSVDWQPTPLP